MAVIQDSTLIKVKNEIHKRNEKLKEFVDLYAATTWDTVQLNVKAGLAAQLYNIGDELVCGYTVDNVTYDFPWVIVDIDREVEMEDGTKRNGLVLQAKYACLEEIQFDASEYPGNGRDCTRWMVLLWSKRFDMD